MNEFKKAPEKAEDFYEKDKVMMPLSEEEQAAKGKDSKKPGKEAKKGKKGKGEEVEEKVAKGPSELVIKL